MHSSFRNPGRRYMPNLIQRPRAEIRRVIVEDQVGQRLGQTLVKGKRPVRVPGLFCICWHRHSTMAVDEPPDPETAFEQPKKKRKRPHHACVEVSKSPRPFCPAPLKRRFSTVLPSQAKSEL
jgi:hypothetical protein